MGRLPAGVHKRKDGRYEKQISDKGHRHTITDRTLEGLKAKEEKLWQDLEHGTYKTNSKVTLDDFFQEWIDVQRKRVKPSSLHIYEGTYPLLSKYLGSAKIAKLERREIRFALDQIAASKGPQRANACRTLLFSILKEAIFLGVCTSNEAQYIRPYKENKSAARDGIHRALTEKEINLFSANAKGSRYFPACMLMLYTGLRAGECFALKWHDINFEKKFFRVDRTITTDEGGRSTMGQSPKTKAGKRTIPMNEKIFDILKEQFNLCKMINGQVNIGGLVFPNARGGIGTTANLNTVIKQICERINREGECLEHFSSHAFRHTFATNAYNAGVPANVLKELMGHESYAMTMDIYAHISNEAKIHAMDLTCKRGRAKAVFERKAENGYKKRCKCSTVLFFFLRHFRGKKAEK